MRVSVSSQAMLTHIMANAVRKEGRTVAATKKIRIFPKNELRFIQALHTYRLAYNLTVEAINAKALIELN